LIEGFHTWLVTGAAGFIGSNLVEALLRADQQVTGFDNFATGFRRNLDEVQALVGAERWRRFRLIEADICDVTACRQAVAGVDYVLHQAALGSVPRSIERPLDTFAANVDGFVKLLTAAREAAVRRFVYASSSSVYGDHESLPKVEEKIGRPLSPYAATKLADEIFAGVYAKTYPMSCVGLRYFNVYGPRQDPDGAYAAVIPKWVAALIRGEPVHINGDGATSRDFCFVGDAVQANLRAALAEGLPSQHEVFNVSFGRQTTLNELFAAIRDLLAARGVDCADAQPRYREFRAGDVRHSLASTERATRLLGYRPTHPVDQGLAEAIDWYVKRAAAGVSANRSG
jgi:UDP-N-acetylglucosamine/UDP-N-acetylgalactosamine 4-epimerase